MCEVYNFLYDFLSLKTFFLVIVTEILRMHLEWIADNESADGSQLRIHNIQSNHTRKLRPVSFPRLFKWLGLYPGSRYFLSLIIYYAWSLCTWDRSRFPTQSGCTDQMFTAQRILGFRHLLRMRTVFIFVDLKLTEIALYVCKNFGIDICSNKNSLR